MTLIDRLCGVVAALAVTLLFSANTEAGAPQLKSQAPGYYRLMLGEFEVTALSDGTFQMDAGKVLTDITPKQLHAALARSFLKDPVEQGDWVAAAHLSFPGIGHLRAAGSGYTYVPVNYGALH